MGHLEKERPATSWGLFPVSGMSRPVWSAWSPKQAQWRIAWLLLPLKLGVKVSHWSFVRPSATPSDK